MEEIAQPLLDKDSSSEFERKPKVEKLRYFNKASAFSKLFFNWIIELISYGNKHAIVQENLEDLKMSDRAEVVYENWASVWNTYKNTDKVAPLKNSIWKAFYKRFILGMIFDFFMSTFTMLTPTLIWFISVYLTDKEKKVSIGFFYLGIVVLVRFFRSFFEAHCGYTFLLLGSDIGNSLSLGMVNKAMNFSVLCNKKFKMGELANLLQVDCAKLSLFPKNFSSVIFFMYQIVYAIVFMSLITGPAFLAGFGVTFLAGIFNVFMSRFTARYQINLARETDNRMKMTNEIFNNIKFIKVNAWEEYFYDKIEAKRKEQLGWIKKKFLIESILTFSMWLAPKMILVATFATFVLTGGDLTPPIAFTMVSLFSYLQFILQFLPNSISIVLESTNAFRRIEKFLLAEELNRTFLTHNKYDLSEERQAISIENGNFYWDRDDKENEDQGETVCHLQDLNVSINKGEFVAIVGDIGTGKSSFLYSLLGQMKFPDTGRRPKVKISGSMSLVTQKPWIVNDTVRNNILFGKEFNRKKYEEVLYHASLKRDLELFTHGDKTMIGEKGATLSGGQKARISFARALYSDSQILLLDDLLSAVDVHVGKFIMNETLRKYCKQKTLLLVTHAIYYLKYVDKILIMEGGRIVEQGSFEKLKNSVRFRQILALLSDKSDDSKKKKQSVDLLEQLDEAEEQKVQEPVVNVFVPTEPPAEVEKPKEEEKSQRVERSLSTVSHTQELANKAEVDKVISDPVINELMISEDNNVGEIPWTLYRSYMQFNGGTIFIVAITFAKLGFLAANTFFNIWLTFWTENTYNKDDHFYINIYLLLGFIYGVFAFCRALIFAFSNVRMSAYMHKEMFSNLLFSSLNQFFDRVPLGRILNRMSKDLNAVDSNFPAVAGNVLVFLFFLIGNVLIIVYCSTVWVLFPVLVYVICCYYLKNYYMKPQRELVRLENISKSPIISCFTEILNGVATIRAYGKESSFFLKNCLKINENKKPQTARKAVEVWFTIRLTFLSFIINIGSISFVLFKEIPEPAKACLLLAMALAFDQLTYYYITNVSFFENELISFERCESFMHLTPEPGYVEYLKNRELLKIKNKERRQQGKSRFVGLWPERGEIKFIDLFVKYRANLDPVLRGLTVTFPAGEKIGVVGRTGSGKSTTTLALLRILEAYRGQILIDGKDISKMSLDDLRSAITIILQDPCLFAGTLRENLDPLNEYSDDDLNRSLDECALREVMAERKGLLTDITENGENLSVGERQLISIARAILKPSKIILIDEATANIDIRTEGVIYKAMNNAFKKSTVITIAHRLNTVINSDKILVLQGGQLKEFDHPQNLLKNPNSFFAHLYNESLKENKV